MTDPELNCLEQLWLKLFDGRDEKLVLSVIIFTCAEVAYVIPSFLYLLCNYISFFDCYKIKPPTLPPIWKCVKSLIIMSLVDCIPLYFLVQPILHMAGVQISTVPFPSFPKFAMQFLALAVINDVFGYWIHRLEHKWYAYYARIHSVHHENYPLFGFAGLYQHPIDMVLLNMISISAPILYSLAIGDLHVVVYVAVLTFQAFTTAQVHSGYDFPWDPLRYVPFLVQPVDHDNHHVVVGANYAAMFTVWDKMCGTYFEASATPAAAAANDE
ncbi:sterol desaturase [Ramicandelaber brevisporus]|nr:sterol desaturase [Ramicandelaber brevisporus]